MWDRLCLIKATNSQNMICFRQLRSLCGNQHMYAPTTHLFRLSPHLLVLSPHLLVTLILCWRLLKIKGKLDITILQRDWQKAQHGQMQQIHRRAFMLYATMSPKHASNHISFVLMKCRLLVTFVSHQPVSCLFLILFFFYVYVYTYIFHPDIYHRKTPSHEDILTEYFGLFFKVCFFCDTKISVFCCKWTHGFILFFICIVRIIGFCYNPKLGYKCQRDRV